MTPKTILIALIILCLPIAAFAQGAEPAPWWQQVEAIQGLLLKWIAALSAVAIAIVGAVFAVWALFKSKLAEITARQDRLSARANAIDTQLTTVALKTPPPTE